MEEPKQKGDCEFCGEPSDELVERKCQEDDAVVPYLLCPSCLNDYEKEQEEIMSNKTNEKLL